MPTMLVVSAVSLVALLGLAAPTTASAASTPVAASATVTKVAEATPPVRPVSVTEGEDEGGTCSRIRRRLWVEGEGWIVRRITTCR